MAVTFPLSAPQFQHADAAVGALAVGRTPIILPALGEVLGAVRSRLREASVWRQYHGLRVNGDGIGMAW